MKVTGLEAQLLTQSKIIEFYGMPGVGKTHLSCILCDILEDEQIKVSKAAIKLGKAKHVNRVLGKLYYIIKNIWKYRTTIRTSLALIQLYRPPSYRIFLKLFFNWCYVCAIASNDTRTSDVNVLDQGIAQALWSTNFYGQIIPDRSEIAHLVVELISHLPVASILMLHVSADYERIMKRIKYRTNGKSPLDYGYQGAWRRALEVTDETRQILNYIAQIMDLINIIDIENNEQEQINNIRTVVSIMNNTKKFSGNKVSNVGG